MNQLATIEHADKPLTAAQVKANVNLIQQVMADVMKEGTHYGKVPGTDQNTLLKPGAEKIMATFRLSADPQIEDLSDAPEEYRYRVIVRLTSPTGHYVGSGVGECSSNETKYKWKRTYDAREFEATPEDRRRIKYSTYKGKQYEDMQIRQEAIDVANTVLKMAKKRALVDAVLTATAASDVFVQDLEELPEGTITDETQPAPAEQPAPQQAPQQAQNTSGHITEKQARLLYAKIMSGNVDINKFKDAFGIKELGDLMFSKMNDALTWIEGESA